MIAKTSLSREQIRTITQASFYLLFLTAPILDIFRFDILTINFIILGHPWMMGFETSALACFDTSYSAEKVLLNFLLPLFLLIIAGAIISWKFGRLYCGWLCPHFSVVETINRLMLKYLNRVTFWEKASLPVKDKLPWLMVLSISILIAFVWAFTLLGYLYPPKLVTSGLVNFNLSLVPSLFLAVVTSLLTFDFFFARHLFCKYGCSVGIMQSVVWMINRKSMVVGFDKSRANLCQSCDSACDKACPMRLPVRGIKRLKFNCTQCGVCLTACDEVQADNPEGRLIHWVTNEEALAVDRKAPSIALSQRKTLGSIKN